MVDGVHASAGTPRESKHNLSEPLNAQVWSDKDDSSGPLRHSSVMSGREERQNADMAGEFEPGGP